MAPKIAIVAVIFFISASISASIPFILLHGIGDECNSSGTKNFTELLSYYSGSQGYCLEIGAGSLDSWFKPMEEQIAIACEKVKQMGELSGGYNIVGQSQGNIIARGIIELCDGGPPVKNYISMAGPHAGMASLPGCETETTCEIVAAIIKLGVYSDFVQDHLAPSGYLKIPTAIPDYLEKCRVLPKLNNERPNESNNIYKERFSSLKMLVLIMFEQDAVLVPRETSWFGYYPDGAFNPVIPVNQTALYIEDWIGLKTLDDTGRVKFVSVPGEHLAMSLSDMQKYVVPYLVDDTEGTTALAKQSSMKKRQQFGMLRMINQY